MLRQKSGEVKGAGELQEPREAGPNPMQGPSGEECAPIPGRRRHGRVARPASLSRAGGGAGAGWGREGPGPGPGGGVGAGRAAPVALGPRGRLYKPAGEAGPAASCSRHSAPSVPAY